MHLIVEETLGYISGGQVLDVGTGPGHFLEVLIENLQDFEHITAIDPVEPDEDSPVHHHERVSFRQMDATRLDFADASFDTVGIAFALHHLPDVEAALSEMYRVLKPDGHLIIIEQFRDEATPTQQTAIDFHHWMASLDRARGVSHNETFTRREILAMAEATGIALVQAEDFVDLSADPKREELLTHYRERMVERLKDVQHLPQYAALKTQGDAIMARVKDIGAHPPTSLLVIGRKL